MKLQINPSVVLKKLIAQEDTEKNGRITVDDLGEKIFILEDVKGNKHQIQGTYHLSNLLQEISLLIKKGKKEVGTIDVEAIQENPTQRISKLIRDVYWDNLTRTIDKKGLKKVLSDEKVLQKSFYIYIPFEDKKAQKYYTEIAKDFPKLKVEILPKKITPKYVMGINGKEGLLALGFKKNGKGQPFVVPGGRFNEMYGWDSYFESVGLLIDKKYDLVKGMIENFEYQIKHYGKILNANRSYYLTRTQPPFYSSMIRDYIESVPKFDINWLSEKLSTAIQEYENVWQIEGKRLCSNGLNRYLAEGIGFVYETEEGHYNEILKKYAEKHQLSLAEFEEKYQKRELIDEELDEYFIHDRSLRESGHDTSNRLVNKCASLNTVDLNTLLYKYETDFYELIKTYFNGTFVDENKKTHTAESWLEKSEIRKKAVNTFLWNEKKGNYYDYNYITKKTELFDSATSLYPLWAKLCSKEQAEELVKKTIPKLKAKGGVLSCTKESRGVVSNENPQRQWDYPYGWAPHQMLIWKGLQNYGYKKEMQEFIYRWLWVITKNAVDYNGTIAEKYDVVNCTHKVNTEYGNVGTNFKYIPDGGFGWMNASYQYGLSLLSEELKVKLNALINPNTIFKHSQTSK